MPINAMDLVNYAREAVGGGYCWGASGETCSPAFRQELAQRAPDQSENLLNLCQKWDGKKVWDCSGLFRGAWAKLLAPKSGGATTMYTKWCSEVGPIGTMPDKPGIAVFRGVLSPKLDMAHVGLYVGGGSVIDARGSAKGVVIGPLGDVAWSHWGRLTDVDYQGFIGPETEKPIYQAKQTQAKSGLNLRPSPSIDAPTKLLIPLQGTVDVYLDNQGNDQSFAYVSYMGIFGYCTRRYLMRLLPEEEPDGDVEIESPMTLQIYQKGVSAPTVSIPIKSGDRIVIAHTLDDGSQAFRSTGIEPDGSLRLLNV